MTEPTKCALCELPIDVHKQCFWDAHTELAFCSERCTRACLWVQCPWCFAEKDDACVGRSVHPSRIKDAKAYLAKMLDTPIQELIDRSSLGAAHVKHLRRLTTPEEVAAVLRRVDELGKRKN